MSSNVLTHAFGRRPRTNEDVGEGERESGSRGGGGGRGGEIDVAENGQKRRRRLAMTSATLPPRVSKSSLPLSSSISSPSSSTSSSSSLSTSSSSSSSSSASASLSTSSLSLATSFFSRVTRAIRDVVKTAHTETLSTSRFSADGWTPTRRDLAAGPSKSCWLLVSPRLPADLCVGEKLFAELWALKPAELGAIVMFGKEVKTPRWTQAYGESYTFSGKQHTALPLSTHPFFQHMQRRISEISGCPYTQMLVNWYADGKHRIGWHADDEGTLANPEWDPTAAIGVWSFSYGATRHFDLRPKRGSTDTSEPKTELRWPAANNTVIGMFGQTQKHYKHQVPTQLTVHEPRINITLRVFGAPFVAYLRDLALRLQTCLTSRLFSDRRAETTLRLEIMSYVTAPIDTMRVRH
jgi:alkylated DNA repair dioxygenase AlkB